MEREECEKKILELMKQIKKVAEEYYGGATHLSMAILEKGSMFAYNTDSHKGGDKPIDVYFCEEKAGEKDGEHQG